MGPLYTSQPHPPNAGFDPVSEQFLNGTSAHIKLFIVL